MEIRLLLKKATKGRNIFRLKGPESVIRPINELSDVVHLKRELGKQLEARLQRELKEGPNFDKGYIIQQVAGHVEMLETLQTFSGHASPQLSLVIKDGIATTEKHLAHAKDILKRYGAESKTPVR